VTFLFTDIEGSTRRWEADADGMRVALAAHDEVVTPVINTSDVDSVESRVMVVLEASAE
jgi:class 3 adenylate cyclase